MTRTREGREVGQLGRLPGLGRGGWGPITPRMLPGGQGGGLQQARGWRGVSQAIFWGGG